MTAFEWLVKRRCELAAGLTAQQEWTWSHWERWRAEHPQAVRDARDAVSCG